MVVIVPAAVPLAMPGASNVTVFVVVAVTRHSPLSAESAPVTPEISDTLPTSNEWPVEIVMVATLLATTSESTVFSPKPLMRHASRMAMIEPTVPLRAGAPAMPECMYLTGMVAMWFLYGRSTSPLTSKVN